MPGTDRIGASRGHGTVFVRPGAGREARARGRAPSSLQRRASPDRAGPAVRRGERAPRDRCRSRSDASGSPRAAGDRLRGGGPAPRRSAASRDPAAAPAAAPVATWSATITAVLARRRVHGGRRPRSECGSRRARTMPSAERFMSRYVQRAGRGSGRPGRAAARMWALTSPIPESGRSPPRCPTRVATPFPHDSRVACDAGGGGRTHTSRGTRDFESRASASSATPARRRSYRRFHLHLEARVRILARRRQSRCATG